MHPGVEVVGKIRNGKKYVITLTIGLWLTVPLYAVEKSAATEQTSWLAVNREGLFRPVVAFETWATYTVDRKTGGEIDRNRGDVSFRRLRFGGKGTPWSWLSYSFQLYLDRLGEDPYAATKGSYGGGPGIWNAFITAKLLKNSELLNVHAGYYWAAISREFNTCPWAVGSFDKSRANWYLRNFITGKGNGIENGVGLGGMQQFGIVGIGYRAGAYEPQAYADAGYPDHLYTGRLMVSIGDPEQTKYRYTLSGNQWGRRTGITIGTGFASQNSGRLSDSLVFTGSTAWGGDMLVNFIGLRIDGEYFVMKRTADGRKDFNGSEWHIRLGYAFTAGKTLVEPCISFDRYDGEGSKALFKYLGDDRTFDIGVNWYLNRDNLKVALHYVNQNGSISDNTGDYIGLAFQFRL